MKVLKHLRQRVAGIPVGRQLYAAFSLILVLTAVVGGVALTGLSRVDAQAASLADKSLRGVGLLSEIRTALLESREFEVKHSRTADTSYFAEYEEKIGLAGKALAASLASYETLVAGDEERAQFDKFKKGWAEYQKASRRVIDLGRAKNQQDAADISDGLASTAFDSTLTALTQLTQHGFEEGKQAALNAAAISARARLWVMALLGAALLLGVGCAYLITRQLLRQLGGEPATATDIARAVAGGDLSTAIPLKVGDTVSLMYQLGSMQRALAEAVTNVRQGSQNVAIASAEIAQGNLDLSQRTEQQASSLQETAATMDELGATVRNNADNAKQANQLAAGASAVAIKGGKVVEQVVETMKGINDSSRKIADIIGVIDSIAFQTNILALNAAVEAARAGEQGRGFAVVAAEVRSLAQRSATAAKEIKALIQASVERVGQGTALVDQAGQTMGEIVGAIQRVADIVGEISSASVEQSAGVSQVGLAITQMDQTTQQNAALVEQSAAAAESMKRQAEQLVQAVEVFKLAQSRPSSSPAAKPGANPVEKAPKPTASAIPVASPVAAPAAPTAPAERRGPNRAKNVARLPAARTATAAPQPAAANTGTDEWESF